MVSSSETGGIWGQIETFFQDILSIFSLNSATDTDSSAPTQAPSTPTQLPATPTELPSTPTELPSTPTQIPATPTEYPDNEHPTIDDNDDRTAGTQDKRTEPDWSVRGGGDIPAGEDDISLNTNTNPSTGR